MYTIGTYTIARHGWSWAVYTEGALQLCAVFNSIAEARTYVQQQQGQQA